MARKDPRPANREEALPEEDQNRQKRSGSRTTRKRRQAAPDSPLRNDHFPSTRVIEMPIVDLTSAPRRVRRADKAQNLRVQRSMETFGYVLPLLVTVGGEVIDGHAQSDPA